MKMKIIITLLLVFTISACGSANIGETLSLSLSSSKAKFSQSIPNFRLNVNTSFQYFDDFIENNGLYNYTLQFNISNHASIRFETDNGEECGGEIDRIFEFRDRSIWGSGIWHENRVSQTWREYKIIITNPNKLTPLTIINTRCPPNHLRIYAVSIQDILEIEIPYNSEENPKIKDTYRYKYAFYVEEDNTTYTLSSRAFLSHLKANIQETYINDEEWYWIKPPCLSWKGGCGGSIFANMFRLKRGWHLISVFRNKENDPPYQFEITKSIE